jgi:hypothetical protein
MIRREAGHDFLLITQADHAAVAQTLTKHFGNAKFAKPSSRTVLAIAMHDAGWPLHDDEPTLNNRHQPLDVFEVPHAISLKVWAASADRAQAVDPYAGLLVSLHSLALSILNSSLPINKDETFDVKKMQDQFAVNKFQHAEIERQEKLRQLLAFNADLPLKHGLAEPKASPQDDQLRFDFRLLQAMDLLSLCLCCRKPPQELTNDVLRNPGASPIRLKITKSLDGVLHVDPWPFEVKLINISIPCRRISAKRFESDDAFRAEYHAAKIESLNVSIGM